MTDYKRFHSTSELSLFFHRIASYSCAQALWVCQANQITWMKLKRNISFAFGEHEPSSSPRYILKCVTRLFVSACNKMQIFSRRLLAFLLLTFIMHFLNCWNPQFTAIIFARTEAMLAKENVSLCRLQLYRNRNCQFHVRHIYENVCVISV